MFKLIIAHYGSEIETIHPTFDEAMARAWGGSEIGESYALDLFDDGVLVSSNRDGSPLTPNTTPLNGMIKKWAIERGYD